MENLHETLVSNYRTKSTDTLLHDLGVMRGSVPHSLAIDAVLKEREAEQFAREAESLSNSRLALSNSRSANTIAKIAIILSTLATISAAIIGAIISRSPG
jgi:hypothetical protein